jgi:hypothetical protein
VYVNVSKFEFAQVQYGKFKLPFGLEENTGAPNLDFVYRALVSNTLAPGRDRGVMFHAARSTSRSSTTTAYSTTTAARVSNNPLRVYGDQTKVFHGAVRPLRFMKLKQIRDAEIGGSWATTNLAKVSRHSRPNGARSDVLLANYPVNGERKRVGFEARWPTGAGDDSGRVHQDDRRRLGSASKMVPCSPLQSIGCTARRVRHHGRREGGRPDVAEASVSAGRIGAVEVAVRVERLSFDSTADLPASCRAPARARSDLRQQRQGRGRSA